MTEHNFTMNRNRTMSGSLRQGNDGDEDVVVSEERTLIAPLYIAAATVGGAVNGLFWGWLITKYAAPTGHPIKRGALIGAAIGGGLATLSVVVGTNR